VLQHLKPADLGHFDIEQYNQGVGWIAVAKLPATIQKIQRLGAIVHHNDFVGSKKLRLYQDFLRPTLASMALHNAANDSQPDAGPFKFGCAVQALKHVEQLVYILHFESRAIVLDEHRNAVFFIPASDDDARA